ncbi:MAG: peptidase C39, partial [Chitinophagaceae bacterium]
MLQALVGALIFTVLGLASSVYVQKIIDHVLVDGNFRLLNLLSVIMLILLLFQFLLGTLKSQFALRTGQHIDATLILGYYKHLLHLPQRFFDTMRVGEIISRVNDAVKIRSFVNDVAIGLIVNGMIILFSLGLMFLYYWKLALIMMLILPVYAVIYQVGNYFSKSQQRALMESGAKLETQLVESLHAAGTIKKFSLEHFANTKTERLFGELLGVVSKAGTSSIYISNLTDIITKMFTVVLLWSGSYFVINRELSPGELLSFYALIGYLTAPAAALIGANRSIQDALIAADRLYEIIDLETEAPGNNYPQVQDVTNGDIIFDNVSFRYGTRTLVFEN